MMSEEEILAVKPAGARYTVAEIIGMYLRFQRELAAAHADHVVGNSQFQERLEAAIRNIPLVGREMWRGSKCQSYCSVKTTCDRIEGIIAL